MEWGEDQEFPVPGGEEIKGTLVNRRPDQTRTFDRNFKSLSQEKRELDEEAAAVSRHRG